MEETRVLRADKSRIWNFLQFSALFLAAGIGSFAAGSMTGWHWPGMIFGSILIVLFLYFLVSTVRAFKTKVVISPEGIMIMNKGNLPLKWAEVTLVTIKEEPMDLEDKTVNRFVVFGTKSGFPASINSSVFSKENEVWFLGLVKKMSTKYGFTIQTVRND